MGMNVVASLPEDTNVDVNVMIWMEGDHLVAKAEGGIEQTLGTFRKDGVFERAGLFCERLCRALRIGHGDELRVE